MHIYRNHFHCCTTLIFAANEATEDTNAVPEDINSTLEVKLHKFWKLTHVQTQYSSQNLCFHSLFLYNDMALSAWYQQSDNALIILYSGYSNQLGYHTCGIQWVL